MTGAISSWPPCRFQTSPELKNDRLLSSVPLIRQLTSLLLPLTSQLEHLQPGEFALADWKAAGLLFPSAVKRGLFTLDETRINRRFGHVTATDRERLDGALRLWLGL